MHRILYLSRDEDERRLAKTTLDRFVEDSRTIPASSIAACEALRRPSKFDLIIFNEDRGVSKIWSDYAEKIFCEEKQKVFIISFDESNRRGKVPFLDRLKEKELVDIVRHLLNTPYEQLLT
jgi:hypothetical protein